MAGRVLLTDHPWPGTTIEGDVLAAADLDLVEAEHGAGLDRCQELARDVAAIMTCWAPVPRSLIEVSPSLQIVARLGVGVDNIDLDAAADRGAVVTNVPDYCVEEVSDHVVALVHAWARGVVLYDRDIRQGGWRPGWLELRRVSDLSVGVVGLGRNGRRTAEKLAALGCTILVSDRVRGVPPSGAEVVDLPLLLERADVVSLHLPLTPQTRHFADRAFLAKMRAGSLLVNTARGGLVDTAALTAALSDHLGAAALDVVEGEPGIPPELLALPNVILTPHVAFSSDRSVADLRRRATEEVVRVLRGQPPVSPVVPART